MEADYILTIFNHRECHWTMMVSRNSSDLVLWRSYRLVSRTPTGDQA